MDFIDKKMWERHLAAIQKQFDIHRFENAKAIT
jgi:hypothetical protein